MIAESSKIANEPQSEPESDSSSKPKSEFSSMMDVPLGALEFEGNYYMLFEIGCTQQEAIDLCESLGGHLLTISSEEEQQFIIQIIKNSKMKNIWLGAYLTEVGWRWSTGELFKYTNWNKGEPNNVRKSQNAIMMYTYNDGNAIYVGKWNDENNQGREDWNGYRAIETGFICEWDIPSSE